MGAFAWSAQLTRGLPQICALLIYTALVLMIQHTGGRSKRSGCLTGFIVSDVIFTGMSMGIITVLARAGVPSNCVGLTRSDCMIPSIYHQLWSSTHAC